MVKRLFTGLVLLSTILITLAAQRPILAWYGDWDGHCPNSGAKYASLKIFPRFERDTGRIVAVNWKTGEVVQAIDQGLHDVIFYGWSPDCHYVVGGMMNGKEYHPRGAKYHIQKEYDSFVWDMIGLRRAATFPDIYPWAIQWEPSSNYAVVGHLYGRGLFLWNIQAQTQFQIDKGYCPLNDYYFDIPAGQLLAVKSFSAPAACSGDHSYSDHQVTVFSLQTGQEIAHYGDPTALENEGALLYFSLSPDGTKLALYSPDRGYPQYGGYLAVVDRASGAITELEAGTTVSGTPSFSPDNHYLVSAASIMRVWDLTAIAPNIKDRMPIYRIELKRVGDPYKVEYTFLDNHTIRYGAGKTAKVFDLLTGQYQ